MEMPKIVLRQREEDGSLSWEAKAVGMACLMESIPCRSASLASLESFADELSSGDCLPVGSVEFMMRAMAVAGLEPPSFPTFPEALAHLAQTPPWLSSAGESRCVAGFVKPAATKLFTGFVHDPDALRHGDADYEAFMALDPSAPVWRRAPLRIESEWRCYLLDGQIVGLARYDQAETEAEEPDLGWLESARDAWFASPGCPACGSVDVARLEGGSLELVECNDGWALGLYGHAMKPKDYASFLWARWRQISRGEALQWAPMAPGRAPQPSSSKAKP